MASDQLIALRCCGLQFSSLVNLLIHRRDKHDEPLPPERKICEMEKLCSQIEQADQDFSWTCGRAGREGEMVSHRVLDSMANRRRRLAVELMTLYGSERK